jgi:serine protease AprX
MNLTFIKIKFQVYNRSVEHELQKKTDLLLHNSESIEEGRLSEARCRQLESEGNKLEELLFSSAKIEYDPGWKTLLRNLESTSRRLSLAFPKNQENFLSELRWITQQGKEWEQLALIQTLKRRPPYDSHEIQSLLDIAENNIQERLETIQYRYRVFHRGDLQALSENTAVICRYLAFTIVEASEQTISQLQKHHPIERLPSIPYSSMVEGLTMRDHEVRFGAPILDEWKQRIEATGARILLPLGRSTLVVSILDEQTLHQIRNFPEVIQVSHYVPEIHVQVPLTRRESTLIEPTAHEFNPHIPDLLIASFFTQTDRDQAAIELAQCGIDVVSRTGDYRLILHLSEQTEFHAAITVIKAQLGLRSLEAKMIEIPFNNVAREIIQQGHVPQPVNITFEPLLNDSALSLTGEGEIIAVADTGLDTGELSTLHTDFQDRIEGIYSFPIAAGFSGLVLNPQDDNGSADNVSGHGTHVAGSVVGSGEQARNLGLSPIQGMAPGAKLIFQALEQKPQWTTAALQKYPQLQDFPLVGIPDDLAELFAPAYEQGARIHSNSWGYAAASEYVSRCEDLDRFAWQYRDFLILVAAGNSGQQESSENPFISPMSIASPGVAKNCLTVGACENGRKGEFTCTYGQRYHRCFPYPPFRDACMVESIEHIAAFSSRGPCQPTQRWKPDVLAPGTFILSTRSSQVAETTDMDALYSPAQQHYMYMNGTSMSTPLIAGAAAIVRQYLRQERAMLTPSAALIKASLIHSASYISDERQHPGSQPWANYDQGWGRVSLKNVLNPDPPIHVEFIDESMGLITGDQQEYKFQITHSEAKLRITLVYTDFPGKQLINNLNLLLLAPPSEDTNVEPIAQYYWGNDFQFKQQPDDINNVEGIRLEHPRCGEWTVRVIASEVQVGVQDFALVVSGGGLTEVIRTGQITTPVA